MFIWFSFQQRHEMSENNAPPSPSRANQSEQRSSRMPTRTSKRHCSHVTNNDMPQQTPMALTMSPTISTVADNGVNLPSPTIRYKKHYHSFHTCHSKTSVF